MKARGCLVVAAGAVLLALAVVGVAGCGGGSSSSTAGEAGDAPLSHAEWVSRADAICSVDHEANAAREAEFEALAGSGLTTPQAREEAAELIRGAVPSVEAEAKAIAALQPSPADEATVERVVAQLERTVDLDEKLAAALEGGSVHELQALTGQIGVNGSSLQALAKELGMKVCGRPGATAGGEGEEMTRAEWTDHANAICGANREAVAAKIEELQQLAREGLDTPRARHEAAEIVRDGIASVETEIESFKDLAAPAALEGEFRKLIAKLETLIGLEAEFADLLDRGRLKALPNAIGKMAKAELSVRGLALHLGLRTCGKLLQAPSGHSLA